MKWIELQKHFGPLHFQRVGVAFDKEDQKLSALLDAAMSLGPLTVALQGLGAQYDLKSKDLSFTLDGMGVDMRRGPLKIGGAFLRMPNNDFAGRATLSLSKFGLTALGLFGEIEGHPSMFLYAFIDYPLGGPSFFFVEGVAVGFGLNRRLIVPPIEQVHHFPLVAEVTGEVGTPDAGGQPGAAKNDTDNLRAEMTMLAKYVPAQLGQYFLAAGLRFTTFKLVDSFALLVLSFGVHFEIDIMGVSTIKVPPAPPVPPSGPPFVLAEAQLEFKAWFSPDEGTLGAQANLTPHSFLLSHDCRLQGGFAFAAWFLRPHAGDFVYTLGGYHPHFHVPTHYPAVRRLGFNWQFPAVPLVIKGGAYFALSPLAMMAGGSLEATWDSGDLKAWFIAKADFLITWKPFHYEASMHVEIGASATVHFFGTHHITISASADLKLWGPEFAGRAHVHVVVISFTVEFGDSSSNAPPKIDWQEFQTSFLPAPKTTASGAVQQVCTVVVQEGLVRSVTESDDDGQDISRWVVNPKTFLLATDSLFPSNQAGMRDTSSTHSDWNPEQDASTPMTAQAGLPKFGIEPMGLSPAT